MKRGGLATTSLVLGIIGVVLGVIPFVNFGAYPFAVLAIIFGLIALSWGKAKAGLILGVIGLAATIIWTVVIGTVFNNAVSNPHTVVYSVTGTIGKADVQYYSSDASGSSKQQSQDSVPLPFTKTVTVKGDFSGFDVEANTHIGLGNSPRGTLACTISVDGKIVSRDSSDGDADVVACDGTGFSGN